MNDTRNLCSRLGPIRVLLTWKCQAQDWIKKAQLGLGLTQTRQIFAKDRTDRVGPGSVFRFSGSNSQPYQILNCLVIIQLFLLLDVFMIVLLVARINLRKASQLMLTSITCRVVVPWLRLKVILFRDKVRTIRSNKKLELTSPTPSFRSE